MCVRALLQCGYECDLWAGRGSFAVVANAHSPICIAWFTLHTCSGTRGGDARDTLHMPRLLPQRSPFAWQNPRPFACAVYTPAFISQRSCRHGRAGTRPLRGARGHAQQRHLRTSPQQHTSGLHAHTCAPFIASGSGVVPCAMQPAWTISHWGMWRATPAVLPTAATVATWRSCGRVSARRASTCRLPPGTGHRPVHGGRQSYAPTAPCVTRQHCIGSHADGSAAASMDEGGPSSSSSSAGALNSCKGNR